MTISRRWLFLSVLLIAGCAMTSSGLATEPHSISGQKLVIAHRGASGYLPEHTIAAKAMAYAQGADYIEQDLVMTKDDELIVLHDHHLDTVSNVAAIFPGRDRDDGRYYVIDFDLDEIRQLSVYERFSVTEGVATPVFEGRFPYGKSTFRIHTFAEEIELIQGLNESTGESVGIYPEIKSPAFHRDAGKDISAAVLSVLRDYGYVGKGDAVYLQCFDAVELQRIKDELMPDFDMSVKLVQLLGAEKEYRWMLSADGMRKVSSYADGVGPSANLLISRDSTAAEIIPTRFVEYAHAAGLQVHPYTFRRERNQIPPFAKNYDDLLRIAFDVLGVDGVFTDFPDLTVKYLTATGNESIH